MVRSRQIKEKLFAWFQLLRLPNLFTVPGDVLAGFTIVHVTLADPTLPSTKLVLCIIASLLLYCAGLLQNDYCDRGADKVERPARPIPSGLVRDRVVIVTAALFFGAAFFLSYCVGLIAFVTTVLLTASISCYNSCSKSAPLWGSLNMGLCRGFNLLLGASILGLEGMSHSSVVACFAGLSLYIAVVTCIASKETQDGEVGPLRWLPVVILALWFSVLYLLISPTPAASLILAGISILWTGYLAVALKGMASSIKIQSTVGELIRGLILIQAVIVSLNYGVGNFFLVLLLLAWPISTLLSKRFYSS
ncbi:MAG: UbiA family prenyltransferase [Planctomycetota bacterium]|jgi:4-hydroxybenzoate polyprenyltransferase